MQATLHPSNYVLFTTNILEPEITSLPYDKFIAFLTKEHKIEDKGNYIEQLNTFQPVLLDCQSGRWKVITIEDIRESRETPYTFQELYALNLDAHAPPPSALPSESSHQQLFQSRIDSTYSFFTKLLRGNRTYGSNRKPG